MHSFTAISRFTKNEYVRWTVRRNLKQPLPVILIVTGFFLVVTALLQLAHVIQLFYRSPLPILLVGIYLVVRPLLSVYSAMRHYNNNAYLQKGTTYTFNEDSILIEAANGNTTMDWSEILKVRETDQFLELYISKKGAHIIRKDGLTREEIDYLKSRVSS